MLKEGLYLWDPENTDIIERSESDDFSRYGRIWSKQMKVYAPWAPLEKNWFKSESSLLLPLPVPVVVVGKCSSTMDVVRNLAAVLPAWGAVIAAEQWEGRGQIRRVWISSPGNLSISWILPNNFMENMPGPISLGYGVTAFLDSFGLKAEAKWPNDVLLEDLKVGGILVEERNSLSVAGLGLNLFASPSGAEMDGNAHLPAGIICPENSPLSSHESFSGPLTFGLQLVVSLFLLYNEILYGMSTSEITSLVEKRMAWLGKKILVRGSSCDEQEAVIQGLSPDGALRLTLTCADGTQKEYPLYSGDIRLL